MYTNIYLVRHAEVDYIPDEYSRPLSEKGSKDVLRLTELFKEYYISRVISSPYLRAINTIRGIAENRGVTIEIVDDFRERKIANRPVEDFIFFTKQQWNDFDYYLEDGENLNEVQARGINALKNIIEKYSGENIVIGTHGTILAAILNFFDKKYNYDFWKSMKMPDVFKLQFKDGNMENIINIKI
ncbi:histidine phosphatase family protein [Tissierella sp. MB52-C2]|uniref:histidine phosphatase family protein n=1 Tax=Tissierella sp. MB52-C2 TaxID=3070999 RepID=UPI00280B835D|nr:histidine phosphatase family protein [Tissierella sp. MB52-C2]WMM25464.1 histidine phosphatase family protein [Tissierella sp. MB52-C2]